MSNFSFLQADFPNLFEDAREAENLLAVSPKAAMVLMRSALENAVNWLYENDRKLERPFRSDLSTLMHQYEFRQLFSEQLFREMNLIRKYGNIAAHGGRVKPNDALASLKYLFRVLRNVAIYYGKKTPETQLFDENLIPRNDQDSLQAQKQEDDKKLKKLLDNLEWKNKEARQAEQTMLEQARENAELKKQLKQQALELEQRKVEREQTVNLVEVNPSIVSEDETRKRYIDVFLREVGWDNLHDGREIEYPVVGMPASTNSSGKGYADYVLWGNNGLPLAVIEAKKTKKNAKDGKHQAVLYADCLEQMHGQRPIIFYTNGFEIYLWDDIFGPERKVQGFYSQDELQRLIDRRDPISGRKDLRQFQPNSDISGRPYQLEAIRRVAENSVSVTADGLVRGRERRSLLVMATGSGKTRTSASLVDMFIKSNWASRVLFLADRNALVSQAKNAFNEHLPHLSAIDLTKEREDSQTRLVFSTYPTMMNRIDSAKQDDQRFYSIGHFDLIIIDEAHRSVYQKYRAIFDYFDAMLIGLTATPKSEVGRDTYELFGIEDGNPTFAYELDDAVKQGFLVPPKAVSVPLKFVREGVKYNELSEQEQAEYEEKFGDPTSEEVPDEIASSAINKWLFNTDTVDKVLAHLMEHGIKVQGGEKLGKSIVFAKNHDHAVFIEERFNKNYPEYAGKFLRVIDNYESKAQDLLETFVDQYVESDPQIAVSVDMMDTGVDAPRVVNLVFFKPVKSSTKFWQMIGRGTRLCPDLFGYGEDKTHFVIFDYCQNFEFFDANPDGVEGQLVKSLTARIFEAKLEVALVIRQATDSSDEQRALAESYIKELHHQVSDLDRDRFVVKAQLGMVEEYSQAQRWQDISRSDGLDINNHLSTLILADKADDEFAKRFDILIVNYQLGLLSSAYSTAQYSMKISGIARDLLKKQNIPAIQENVELLKQVEKEDFWQEINVNRLEDVRVSMRDLLKNLDKDKQAQVVTKFEDHLDHRQIKEIDVMPAHTSLQSYKDRVESYVRDNSDHSVIRKLKNNQPITELELEVLEDILFDSEAIGSKEDYLNNYGDKPLGVFVRGIVGLDSNAAQNAFADFIQAGNLSADQITFIDTIIKYLTQNGVIERDMLFEPPFTHMHDQGLMGIFDDAKAMRVMGLLDTINNNALGQAVSGM